MAENAEQPSAAPTQWSKVYAQCRLTEYGVTFDKFLSNPWGVLTAVGQVDAPASILDGFQPLLPKQAAVAKRLRNKELAKEMSAEVVNLGTWGRIH